MPSIDSPPCARSTGLPKRWLSGFSSGSSPQVDIASSRSIPPSLAIASNSESRVSSTTFGSLFAGFGVPIRESSESFPVRNFQAR